MKQQLIQFSDTAAHAAQHVTIGAGVTAIATSSNVATVITVVSTAVQLIPKVVSLFGSIAKLFKRKKHA